MAEQMAPMKEGMRNTNSTPKESTTPFLLRSCFLELKQVVMIPQRAPIIMAGQGLGNTLELDPQATPPLVIQRNTLIQPQMTSWTAILPRSQTEVEKDMQALAERAYMTLRGAICLKSLMKVVLSVWDCQMQESQGMSIHAKMAPMKARV